MAITKDKIEVEIGIKTEQAAGSMASLKKEVKDLERELLKLNPASQDFEDKLKEIGEKSKALDEVTARLKNVKAAANDASQGAATNSGLIGKFTSSFDALKGALVPLLALKGAFDLVSGSVSAFSEGNQVLNEMTRALDGNEAAAQGLVDTSKKLEGVTIFDDNEIQRGESTMATLNATREEVDALAESMLDYATFKETDAVASGEALAKALNGEAGELADLGLELTDTMTRSERLAAIQKVLGETVAGAARTAAESGTGSWTILKNKANDALESIGGAVVSFFNSTNSVSDTVNTKLDEIATRYKNASEEQKQLFRKNLESQGQSIETVTNRIAELEQRERAEAAKTRAELIGKYNDLTKAEQDFYAQRARALGVSEETISKFRTDAITKQKTDEEAARKAEIEANKDKYKALADQAKAAADKRKADEEAAEKNLAQLRVQAIDDDLTRNKAAAELKATNDIAALKGNEKQKAEATILIREQLAETLKALDDKAAADKAAADAKRLADEKAAADKAAADLAASKEQTAANDLARLDAQHANTMALFEVKTQDQLTVLGDNEGAKFQLQEAAAIQALDMQSEYLRQRLELIQQSGTAELSTIEAANIAIAQSDSKAAAQRAANAQRTAKVKADSEKLGLKAASDGLDALVGLLGKDEEARKKNAGAIKVFQTSKVAIDLISEIQAIWKNNNSNPTNALIPGFGTALSIAQTAIAAARAGTAIAQINATKFERGGQWLGGRRHSQGGNPVLDGNTGQVIAELEQGEVILSRNTYANNADVVDALLNTSMYKNGQRIYETGGIFSTPSLNTTPTQVSASSISVAAIESNRMLTATLNELSQSIKAMPTQVKASIVYSELEAASNEVNQIRNLAKV